MQKLLNDPFRAVDEMLAGAAIAHGRDFRILASGRGLIRREGCDGRRVGVAIENVIIQGCTMKDGHGGVTIGSEISGSARNVFAEDCRMDSPNLNRALRLKTNSYRGGVIENIYMRNIAVGQVSDAAIDCDFFLP